MVLNLTSFVSTYINKKNPATSKRYTPEEIAAAMQIPMNYLTELMLIVNTTNASTLDSDGRLASDSEILVAIASAHPNMEPVITPFGLNWTAQPTGSDRKFGDLTVDEVLALLKSTFKL